MLIDGACEPTQVDIFIYFRAMQPEQIGTAYTSRYLIYLLEEEALC